MYASRRRKYFDLIACCSYGIFFFVCYHWRADVYQSLSQKQKAKKEAVAYRNSLKEELKVVFQHTKSLEKLLKSEQRVHRERFNELRMRDEYFFANISKMEDEYKNNLKQTETMFQTCRTDNINIKQKHLEFQQRYIRTSENYNLLTGRSEEDVQALKQSSDMTVLSLNDRVEDLSSQQKYFKKLSLQFQEDYKKTLNKLNVCYHTLTNTNSSAEKHVKGSSANKRKLIS